MTDNQVLHWFPLAFPILFVGTWLVVSVMLGFMSGWFNLQQWYADDGGEEPLLKLRGQSGVMGAWVNLNGCLKLWAYPSGLGIRIWRIVGPFEKPLKVPWSEIEAEPSSSFFVPMVKLHLGKPENGTLKISAKSWARLIAAVKPVARTPLPYAPPADNRATALAMFVQWAVISAFVGIFFFVVTRSQPHAPPTGFVLVPMIALGVAQLIRFTRS